MPTVSLSNKYAVISYKFVFVYIASNHLISDVGRLAISSSIGYI